MVGRPEIQNFAGALQAHRTRKGILITTSRFSCDAREYVKMIDGKIVLIDGEQLAQLMIDFNLGVAPDKVYEILLPKSPKRPQNMGRVTISPRKQSVCIASKLSQSDLSTTLGNFLTVYLQEWKYERRERDKERQ